jgi:hypothetical protein
LGDFLRIGGNRFPEQFTKKFGEKFGENLGENLGELRERTFMQNLAL